MLGDAVEGALGERVVEMVRVRGGDVAEAYRVTLERRGPVFAKTHRAAPPGFFTTEAAGLRWLREAHALPVPEVLAVDDETPMLVLEWIEEDGRGHPDEAAFGRALATLHQAGAPLFGREDGRTTGSRALPNAPCDTWPEFYASQRLLPLARLIRDAQHLDDVLASRLEVLATRVDEIAGSAEPPARLHGDLWAGNRLVARGGQSWLIDPACFGGHREFDLAMMRLFGGFGEAAFAAYAEAYPLTVGWRERVPLHHLAPLAIHAIKFGGGYVAGLDGALAALGA